MITMTIIACILMYIQAKKIIIKKVEADIGVKIVLLSDLHFNTVLVKHDKILRAVEQSQPEVIAITGDLCNSLKKFYRVEDFLKKLSEQNQCPILVTLGNHDNEIFEKTGYNKADYIAKIEKVAKNIHVLENEKYVYNDVMFCGLGDVKSNKEDCNGITLKWQEEARESGCKFVVLTHNPDMVLNFSEEVKPNIMLSGHTHGGQMKMPFNIEFALLKKDVLPKRKIYYGEHIYNGKKMYITSGIGCSALPFRLFSTAEVAVIK